MLNKGYSSEFIETVKTGNNIIDVARSYLTLKQKGQDFWACCPFHHEKTPSFKISNTHQSYYCFGCKASGNVISFIMQMENLSYREALEYLAKRIHLELPKLNSDDEYQKTARKKERILSALVIARDYYCKNLSEKAREYLHSRGIDDELIKLFHIGYSPNWQGVIDELKKNKFTEAEMKDAGIVSVNDKGHYWDAQYERITFSIHDIYGNCIGFTGRTMSNEKDIAKYKNTAETIVYNKSNVVYGVDVMKQKTRNEKIKGVIAVEGNVDEIAMIKNGFNNTIACMGTALTQFHAKIFHRFGDEVCLCFDGDSAGQKASLRSLKILADEGLSVRVVTIPDELDPDDYLKKNGTAAMNKLLTDAVGATEFRLDCLAKESDLKDNVGKTIYLKKAIEILNEITIPAERELYLPKVASVSGVGAESIRLSLNRAANKPPVKSEPVKIQTQIKTSAAAQAELFVISSLAHKMPAAVIGGEPPQFMNASYGRLLQLIHDKGDKWNLGCLYDEFEPEELKLYEDVINYQFTGSDEEQKKEWADDIICLQNAIIDKEIEKLQKNSGEDPVAAAKEIQRLKGMKNGGTKK